jgi:hypothetical protein
LPHRRIARFLHRTRAAVTVDRLGSEDFTGASGKVCGDYRAMPGTVAGMPFEAILPLGTLLAIAIERHFERFAGRADCKKNNGVNDRTDSIN